MTPHFIAHRPCSFGQNCLKVYVQHVNEWTNITVQAYIILIAVV